MNSNKFNKLSVLILSLLIIASCSRKETETEFSAEISGVISVDPELARGDDSSGIRLLTTIQSNEGVTDTLFYAVTDSSGLFSGRAIFPENDIYPVLVSRNQNVFGIFNVIFADGDTIRITGSIPNIPNSIEIESRENDVYNTFERVDRGFTRIANFINAGMISADSIGIEIEKWSDIYWEVYETYPGTYAGNLSAQNSVTILRDWNDSLMESRANELIETGGRLNAQTLNLLVDYYGQIDGLDRAIRELDRIKELSSSSTQILDVEVQKIELLYDSSRTREANRLLDEFRNRYSSNRYAMEWAENISYDLEFLTPGYPFPEFSFITTTGDSVSNQSMSGRPFLIEIIRFENFLYQQQFDRTVSIHQIYKNFDLEIITVPIGPSRVMLDAFFEERSLLWDVVEPGSFDVEELLNLLNINRVPTRFLVDREGNIIRRYIGNEYDDVVRGLQQIINNNNQ